MGSLTLGLKKFLQNKNTVTVIGVVLAIFALYFAYTMRVKNDINPITVPYATEQILSTTRITEGMISTRLVPPSMLEGDVILDINEIVDKYVNTDTVIPKGSLFYRRAVVESENLERSPLPPYSKSYEPYQLPVNVFSTYGNSMLPNNYVDIWLTAIPNPSTRDKVMIGKLFSNVKILTVRDSGGDNVFQNMDEQRIPETITFAMPAEYIQLLMAALKLEDYEVHVELVQTHEILKDNPGEVTIAS